MQRNLLIKIDQAAQQQNNEKMSSPTANNSLSPYESLQGSINTQENMAQRKRQYPSVKEQEQLIYRRLLIIGVVLVLVIIVFFFWGIPIFIRLAEFLNLLRGNSNTPSSGDVIPPFTPRLESPPIATNSAKLPLVGSAEAGSTIELFLNGELKKKLLVGQDARFTIEDFNLGKGENRIEIRSTDQAGNTSPLSSPLTITLDTEAPPLVVSEPKGGTIFSGGNRDIKISGSSEAGATVTVNGFLAIVDSDSKFSYSYSLASGENVLEISAKDAAGNTSQQKISVVYSP